MESELSITRRGQTKKLRIVEPDFDRAIIQEELKKTVKSALSNLRPLEAFFIAEKYGIEYKHDKATIQKAREILGRPHGKQGPDAYFFRGIKKLRRMKALGEFYE